MQKGNECRPQLTHLLIHRAFAFLPRDLRLLIQVRRRAPAHTKHRAMEEAGSSPCTARHEDIPIPQLLWKALSRLMFHTLRLQSILVIPACDCATTPTSTARVAKGKQQRQEAEIITKLTRPCSGSTSDFKISQLLVFSSVSETIISDRINF